MAPHLLGGLTLAWCVQFEGLVVLSLSECCELMFSMSQGIDWRKVPAVWKNGKLNEMIEVSALRSNSNNLNLI